MASNRIQLPSGMGGLTRYFEEYKSKITVKPGHIILIAIVIIFIVVILHMQGPALLGIR